MTRDEAREAGLLAAALEEIDDQLERIADDEHSDKDPLGIGFAFDICESGSTGFGDAILPRNLAIAAIKHLRALIAERLIELGIEVEHTL